MVARNLAPLQYSHQAVQGQLHNIASVAVHDVLPVAAVLDNTGALVLWALAPDPVPLQLPTDDRALAAPNASVSATPASWRHCHVCCWLPTGRAANSTSADADGENATSTSSDAASRGVSASWELVLASAAPSGVHLTAVHVTFRTAPGSQKEDLLRIEEVRKVKTLSYPTPALRHVTSMCVATDPTSAKALRLLALADAANASNHSLRANCAEQQAWLSWDIEVHRSGVDMPNGSLPGSSGTNAQASSSAGAAGSLVKLNSSEFNGSPSTSTITCLHSQHLPALGLGAHGMPATSSLVTCVHHPAPDSNMLVAGDAGGCLHFLRISPASSSKATAAAPGSQKPGHPDSNVGASNIVRVQSVACALTVGGAAVPLTSSRCLSDDVVGGGSVIAAALSSDATLAAAVTSCGIGELEEALYIWCAGSSTLAVQPPPPADCSGSSDGGRQGWPSSADSTGSEIYRLGAAISLHDTPTSVQFLDTAGLGHLVAVGYSGGVLEVFCHSRDGTGWQLLGCHTCSTEAIRQISRLPCGRPNSVPPQQVAGAANAASAGISNSNSSSSRTLSGCEGTAQATAFGLPVIVAGSQIMVLSNQGIWSAHEGEASDMPAASFCTHSQVRLPCDLHLFCEEASAFRLMYRSLKSTSATNVLMPYQNTILFSPFTQ